MNDVRSNCSVIIATADYLSSDAVNNSGHLETHLRQLAAAGMMKERILSRRNCTHINILSVTFFLCHI